MRVNVNWKRVLFVVVDLILAAYLVMAVTLWNTPASASRVCSKVDVNISDANNVGFLSAEEIKHILTQQGLYPLGKPIAGISPRSIEEVLRTSPFVNTAECHVTQNGHVTIALTQRVPIIRIKSSRGDDYYIDDKGGPMPNSKYTSDLIIATSAGPSPATTSHRWPRPSWPLTSGETRLYRSTCCPTEV